jgi:hypothetical protein
MRATFNLGKHFFLIYFLLLIPVIASAQQAVQQQGAEVTLPLFKNGVLANPGNSTMYDFRSASLLDTIELPFYDDFSRERVWPDNSLWLDSSVYVNFGFGINPPSVGVATFDGLNLYGDAYNSTNAGASGLCDVLTSLPIDLFDDASNTPYLPSDSIFLVFYYQRKGRGDNPEVSDSLSLQFFNVLSQSWQYVWSATGISSGDTVFTKVKIRIDNPSFRQKGFKFRFRNYGSQNGMLDIWNIDNVHLNKFLPPAFDVVRDYSFVNQGFSILNGYTAVPRPHFNALSSAQQVALIDNSANLLVRNNNDASPFPISVSGKAFDRFGNQVQLFGGGGLNSIIIPLNTNSIPPASITPFFNFSEPTSSDQTYFDIVYSLGQTSGGLPDDFTTNDTLYHRQHFYDYYAYDDGSAELAYGINGVNAKLAYRFDLLQGDTLRAINMFFAQSGVSVASQQFRLAVWSGNTSGPQGNPVYEKLNQTPVYLDSLNQFKTYLTDPVYLNAGTWYFGFIQNNSVLLNLGLDMNTPADPSKKYYNTSGSWLQSQLPGMWMIRPVFSSSQLYTGVNTMDLGSSSFHVYPNPVQNDFNIIVNSELHKGCQIEILDMTGRILVKHAFSGSPISTSDLPNGVYVVRLTNVNNGIFQQTRIVIQHQ